MLNPSKGILPSLHMIHFSEDSNAAILFNIINKLWVLLHDPQSVTILIIFLLGLFFFFAKTIHCNYNSRKQRKNDW